MIYKICFSFPVRLILINNHISHISVEYVLMFKKACWYIISQTRSCFPNYKVNNILLLSSYFLGFYEVKQAIQW